MNATEETRIIVGSITSEINQLKAHLLSTHSRLMDLYWKPKVTTTQAIADALGADTKRLYLLSSALQRFLDLNEPGNEQLLEQFASAERPTIKAPTRQPLAVTEWTQDGMAIIVPNPEPEPEPEPEG